MADRLICLEQRHESEPKRILHAWTPERVELALEDAQRVADSLVAVPAQSYIQKVDAERTLAVGEVEVDHVTAALLRHKAQCRRRQVAVRVHQDETPFLCAG